MCGFVCVAGNEKKVTKSQIQGALQTLNHRGPDASAIWQNESATVSMGHVRLSIIDLAGGTQPLSSSDGTLTAVVNGELYDYRRIKRELSDWGYRFQTESDSEILLGLYARYGVRCLEHMRGEFAFALWDSRNRWIFAARDYFGIKPLFYHVSQGSIYFASEVKALAPLGVPMSWDEDNFYQTLNFLPPNHSTLFKGVRQIPPAHYLLKPFASTDVHLQKYWDFNYPLEGAKHEPQESEAIEGVANLLKEAIGLRLQADVPVASYLSGGLDSCAILGIAQKISSTKIPAFTLTFNHSDYDEAQIAAEMAEFAGAPYHPVAISQADIAQHWGDAVWHGERFLINGHAVAKHLLSRAVRKAGYKVVLTGEGSDEIFAGYAHFRQDQILYSGNTPAELRQDLLQALSDNNKVSQGLLLSQELNAGDAQSIENVLGYVPGWIQSFIHQSHEIAGLLDTDYAHTYAQRHPALALLAMTDLGQVRGREKLDQSLYLWSRTLLPYYLLTVLGDRMEMAHSVEGRVPFLDHKLVEYVVQLPSHFKIRDLTEKYALREAAKPYLTRTVYERQKHPFLAPPSLTAENEPEMQTLIQDTLRSQELDKIPFLNAGKVRKYLDQALQGDHETRSRRDILLNSITSACFMQKQFFTQV